MTTTESPAVVDSAAEVNDETALIEAAKKKSDELLDPKTFGFIDFIRKGGETLPTEDIVAFTDLQSALTITGLRAAREKLEELAKQEQDERYQQALLDTRQDEGTITYVIPDRGSDEFKPVLPQQYYDAADQIQELNQKLWDSRIVLSLKGIAPRWLAVIEEKLAKFRRDLNALKLDPEEVNTQWSMRRTRELVAASLQAYAVPSQDFTSTEKMSTEDVGNMLSALAPSEQGKILQAVQVLTYSAVISDPRTDAGFPGGHPVSAAEPGTASPDQDSTDVAPTP